MVRQVDSSLLDEWERLADPDAQPGPPDLDAPPPPLTANHRAFTVLVRNTMFRRVELLARHDWDSLGELDGDSGWTANRWREAFAPYFEEFTGVTVGPSARSPRLLVVDEQRDHWSVRQIIDDPEEQHAWAIVAKVDLRASDEQGRAVVEIMDVVDT